MKVIETKEVTVEGYPGSKVTMYTKGNWAAYRNSVNASDILEKASAILPNMIVDWNFDDQDGNMLEITSETISKLPTDLVAALLNEAVLDFSGSLKKKTSEESLASSKELK